MSIRVMQLHVERLEPTQHRRADAARRHANFYFNGPKAEMPTIRQLTAEGARADGMKASLPTVNWLNHTTLVTGVTPARHGVVGNNFYDRGAGRTVAAVGNGARASWIKPTRNLPALGDLAAQAAFVGARRCAPCRI